ncbi:MAG: hypothetical protein ACP5I8_05780 [Phycisphaerae bacterium]
MAGLFPPQDRDWSLPSEVPLTPLAAERVSREAADRVFDDAARSLNLDWQTQLDGKQVQRWSERMGDRLIAARAQEIRLEQRGVHPAGPLNAPELLVVGMDGGRVHTRDKDPKTQRRWREDKVASFTSYIPGDGQERKPQALVTTYTATMKGVKGFGPMVKLEGNRRGIARAAVVLNISDGGNWIDPLATELKLADCRIIDYYHAVEHVHALAATVHGQDTPQSRTLAAELESLLWEGKVNELVNRMKQHETALSGERPKSTFRRELGYFEKHQEHMHYDIYRRKGWPIGSGNTEAGVKTFNKRVKGTEQRWRLPGAEAIVALRAAWKSQDGRWERLWANRPAYVLATATKKAA